MNARIGQRTLELPETVNMHVIGACNYRCKFCYSRMENLQHGMDVTMVREILAELRREHVERVTFVGGEPTLHNGLCQMLRAARGDGLDTSMVSNGSLIDAQWCDEHLPFLNWLALSLDSADPETCVRLGRQPKGGGVNHPAQVERVASLVHKWNAAHPWAQVELKVNLVVTSLNWQEDPSEFLKRLRPTRVKALACGIRPEENPDAHWLTCTKDQFEQYLHRLDVLRDSGITVSADSEFDQLGSYAMIDPEGRFFQTDDSGRYLRSERIVDVGAKQAWIQVGGYDRARFIARGGDYTVVSRAR